ncbi:hypothetical protein OHT57_33980 [Streptomyces sp. NBC_00285]|uniref:hypothetical protein n=1 Tax=Streptomyces sp. NBC_00285 TaxID=2975700 RepID=UPI002E2BDD10|nr:hypothetical protein [Streptomyces sp. NBC_00285]
MNDEQQNDLRKEMNKRFDDLDDQFAKLFDYLEERMNKTDASLDNKAEKSEVGRVLQTLDGLSGRLSDVETEQAAHASQLDRHEKKLKQLKPEAGLR